MTTGREREKWIADHDNEVCMGGQHAVPLVGFGGRVEYVLIDPEHECKSCTVELTIVNPPAHERLGPLPLGIKLRLAGHAVCAVDGCEYAPLKDERWCGSHHPDPRVPCEAVTRSGYPCHNLSRPRSRLCWQHERAAAR